jgi:hypothetical protein
MPEQGSRLGRTFVWTPETAFPIPSDSRYPLALRNVYPFRAAPAKRDAFSLDWDSENKPDSRSYMTERETGIIVTNVKRPHDIYIGRANRFKRLPRSKWANPYPLPDRTPDARRDCLRRYREHVLTSPDLIAALRSGELIGKSVGCYCYPEDSSEPPPEPYCHGDVLRELSALLYEG